MIHADDRSVELVNRAWTALTGYEADGLRTTEDWARLAYGEKAPNYLTEAEELFTLEGKDEPREREITTRDGRTITWIVHSALLDRKKDGKRVIITTAVDITERVAAEREAQRQQRLLIQSEKMASLGLLVAGMAHEVGNPNHAIRLNAGFLTRVWASLRPILDRALADEEDSIIGGIEYAELRDRLPSMLRAILDASGHIESIVRGLRDYSRSEECDSLEEVGLNHVVEAAVGLLRDSIDRATSHFHLELEPSLPAVLASFHGLEQVLVNLIQNACQSLENRSKAIGVSSSFDGASKLVRIVVRDEGRGMGARELEHIRDPFFTTKRGEGGLGLGIPISVTILEKLGGRLEFQSVLGMGTTAILELPALIHDEGQTS